MSTAAADAAPDQPASETAALGPIERGQRIHALDLIRGVALFGILVVNMLTFGLPSSAAFSPVEATGDPADILGHRIVQAFFQFKFIALFSMLFGMGIAVQAARAVARGRSFTPVFFRRLVVLGMLGAVHAILFWYGDILFTYALCGVGLLLLFRVSAKLQFWLGTVFVVIGLTAASAVSGFTAWSIEAMETTDDTTPAIVRPDVEPDVRSGAGLDAGPDAGAGLDGAEDVEFVLMDGSEGTRSVLDVMFDAQFNPHDSRVQALEHAVYGEGPLTDAIIHRAVMWGLIVVSLPFGLGWQIVGMFLVGSALLRTGFFDPGQRRRRVRYALLGIGIGLPCQVIGTWNAVPGADGWILWWMLQTGTSFVLALGYLGGLALLADLAWVRRIDAPIVAAGRMALSVYLAETLIGTFIFYWWGLARFGSMNQLELVGLSVLVYAGLALVAWGWSRFFRMGPVEWVWRLFTYGTAPPLRRPAADGSAGTMRGA